MNKFRQLIQRTSVPGCTESRKYSLILDVDDSIMHRCIHEGEVVVKQLFTERNDTIRYSVSIRHAVKFGSGVIRCGFEDTCGFVFKFEVSV